MNNTTNSAPNENDFVLMDYDSIRSSAQSDVPLSLIDPTLEEMAKANGEKAHALAVQVSQEALLRMEQVRLRSGLSTDAFLKALHISTPNAYRKKVWKLRKSLDEDSSVDPEDPSVCISNLQTFLTFCYTFGIDLARIPKNGFPNIFPLGSDGATQSEVVLNQGQATYVELATVFSTLPTIMLKVMKNFMDGWQKENKNIISTDNYRLFTAAMDTLIRQRQKYEDMLTKDMDK